MTPEQWAQLDNFSEDEFRCKCGCGRADMDWSFMQELQAIRTLVGKPFIITSGFRCPAHNQAVSSTGPDGPHTTGKATDIACHGALAYEILDFALTGSIKGVGLNQKGPHAGRFVHVDTLPDEPRQPRPWVWTY